MCTENEFNKYRNHLINNINNNQYALLPAYYYYANHVSGDEVVDLEEFQDAFYQALEGGYNIISQQFTEPVLDYSGVEACLLNYYSVHILFNDNGVQIKAC